MKEKETKVITEGKQRCNVAPMKRKRLTRRGWEEQGRNLKGTVCGKDTCQGREEVRREFAVGDGLMSITTKSTWKRWRHW